MSLDYSTYIGAYIEVYNPEKPSTKKVTSCQRLECQMYSKLTHYKFCPTCGTEVGLVEVPSGQRININEYTWFSGKLYQFFRESSPETLKDHNIYETLL